MSRVFQIRRQLNPDCSHKLSQHRLSDTIGDRTVKLSMAGFMSTTKLI